MVAVGASVDAVFITESCRRRKSDGVPYAFDSPSGSWCTARNIGTPMSPSGPRTASIQPVSAAASAQGPGGLMDAMLSRPCAASSRTRACSAAGSPESKKER